MIKQEEIVEATLEKNWLSMYIVVIIISTKTSLETTWSVKFRAE